ncbi:MAG: gfo/Idh/MocA family oxidoreductase [bacterium]|nr:gfo/Idh/MocA family oxidoreductase [bacterium]
MTQLSRRLFTRAAGLAAVTAPALNALGANDAINLGVIGCGGRGQYDLSMFLRRDDIRVTALCDACQYRIDETLDRQFKDRQKPQTFRDFRQLLDKADVHAVLIATPDHWHAIPFIHACEAGKDVYSEKPLSLTIVEGRKMVEAAHKNNRVTQIGTQQRTIPHFREAVGRIHAGELGQITHVECWNVDHRLPSGLGNPPDGEPPEGVDWDLWLGPAPNHAFNPNRLGHWRWFWDYSGGQMTDWGTHHMDVVQWALQRDYPIRVTSAGGKYALPDNTETPDTFDALFEYEGGVSAKYFFRMCSNSESNGRGYGMLFYGTDAVMFLNRGGYEITPIDAKKPAIKEGGSDDTFVHVVNFIENVRSRGRCNADVSITHRSTSATHLANISHWTQEKLEWDGEKERITNHRECNKHLNRRHRSPWKV